MKKNIRLIGAIFAVAMLGACSNNDDDKSDRRTGTAVFFHNVSHASTLSLESIDSDRGFGTVDFEEFGPGIQLNARTWDLAATDLRDETDGSDDAVILSGASFKVSTRRRSVYALVGDADERNVELVSIPMAYDEEMTDDGDDNNDGIADRKSLYINFANIHSGFDRLDVYLVTPDKCVTDLDVIRAGDSSQPSAVIDFKQTSADLRMRENITKYCLRVAEAGSDTEIYNSGERTLKDYAQQTILIAPYSGTIETNSPVSVFYYFGIDNKFEKWPHTDSFGQVRLYNVLRDSVDLGYVLDNGVLNVAGPANLAFNDLSAYNKVSTKYVSYSVLLSEAGDDALFDGIIQPIVNVQQGESWTVILMGHYDLPYLISSIIVPETDTVFTTKASLTVTNAAYIEDEDYRDPYNVHITTSVQGVTNQSVVIPLLAYADYGVTTINAGNTYKVSVTDQLNSNNKATPYLLTVEGGENIHLVLKEKAGGGKELVRLVGAPGASRSVIEISDEFPAAGENVTVTVVMKDNGGNKLSDRKLPLAPYAGGDDVEVCVDSLCSPATDNADGTYSATVTSPVADTVTISATLNSADIADTAELTFTAP